MCFQAKCWIFLVFIIHVELISLTAANDHKHCPDVVQTSRSHVATFNRTCYLFVNKEVYWEKARESCWEMGGEMLVIPNQVTMDFIKKELYSRKLGWSSNGVWNGANDLKGSGWEWTTGEKLKYSFWASGEPGEFLDIFSIENCACMRRNDGWRWHDYPCDIPMYKYKYICQFGFMQYRPTDTEAQHHPSGTHMETSEDLMTVVGLAIGGVVLLVLMCSVTYLLYRKHEHQKATAERPPSVRFQNAGYATIIQDVSRNNGEALGRHVPSRPTSNVYFDPAEVTRIYDEVNKHTNHGINSLSANETANLMHTGGASNLDDVDGGYVSNIASERSSDSTDCCNTSTEPNRGNESEYVEMSGGTSLNSVEYENGNTLTNTSLVSDTPVKDNNAKPESVEEMKPAKEGAEGQGAPGHERQSNIYVEPTACTREAELKQTSAAETLGNLEVEGEMHVYTNSLDLLESQKGRPLPPIPKTDYEIPIDSLGAV